MEEKTQPVTELEDQSVREQAFEISVRYPVSLDFYGPEHLIEYQRLYTIRDSELWSEWDLAVIFDASFAMLKYREAMLRLHQDGVVVSGFGNTTINPAIDASAKLLNVYLKLERKLLPNDVGRGLLSAAAKEKNITSSLQKESAIDPIASLLAQPG